jgi:predicted amidohydrolase
MVALTGNVSQGFVTDWNLSEDISPDSTTKFFSSKWMHRIANDYQITVAGSMAFYKNERLYNRLIAVQPHKDFFIYPPYNEKHLFGLANKTWTYHAGLSRVIWQDEHWSILSTICYDLRFPVWLRNRKDYQLMFCVANWPQARAYAWRSLLTARAIENQAFVVGVKPGWNEC